MLKLKQKFASTIITDPYTREQIVMSFVDPRRYETLSAYWPEFFETEKEKKEVEQKEIKSKNADDK